MNFFYPTYKMLSNYKIQIYPEFVVKSSKNLMIRGRDFYAVWDEKSSKWTTDENDVFAMIDDAVKEYRDNFYETHPGYDGYSITTLYIKEASSGVAKRWHEYVQKLLRDNYHQLDSKLVFMNDIPKQEDYSTHHLNYELKEGSTENYDRLMSKIYAPEERAKLEWAIGAVVSGDSRTIQKCIVMSGDAGTGKSTVIKIIQMLFDGYWAAFDAKALTSNNGQFALEPLKDNPLVALQDDADLSRIEENVRLNSLISHEVINVNEKYKSLYSMAFQCFLFLGTNKDVEIREIQSGLTRRIIDVVPSGKKLSLSTYKSIMSKIPFELGGIAYKCWQFYDNNKELYDNYIPTRFMRATNFFYNFMEEQYMEYLEKDEEKLEDAWSKYQSFVTLSGVQYPLNKMAFRREFRGYWREYIREGHDEDGRHIRQLYRGFKHEKFGDDWEVEEENDMGWLRFDFMESLWDVAHADCLAQYDIQEMNPNSTSSRPIKKWENCKTTLKDVDTRKLHYVCLNKNEIVIDFDEKGEDGEKSLEKNILEASKWPQTYAEVSKSGSGIHLHYIFDGDVDSLANYCTNTVEIKTNVSGKQPIRRKLSGCNNLAVAHLPEGSLPRKEKKSPVISEQTLQDERHLRAVIAKCLRKEISQPYTKVCMETIKKVTDDAYNSGMKYDISDLRPAITTFAARSSHQAETCLEILTQIKWHSEEGADHVDSEESDILFFDCEVFQNLFIICYKRAGEGQKCVKMINPTPEAVRELFKYRLIGFNNRRYDNHILYYRTLGYTNEQLYDISQKIVNNSKNALNVNAYNLSYTDVYDFSSSFHKQSLKKWEIELGIHHQEFPLPWDEPVPEDRWNEAAEYCCNDVLATEAVFNHLKGDWTARQILADIADGSVNDSTNKLTTKIIFGDNKNPQTEFNYVHLEEMFPGYKYDHGVSSYKDVPKVGEGGYVYSEPGMYTGVRLLDVESEHPHSILAMILFGERYTKRFGDLVKARLLIKHKDFDGLNDILDGKLVKYVDSDHPEILKDLSNALKTAINSVYGLTDAKFENAFKDPRNIDNIVAKRGALFMIDLRLAVQEKGYTVAHIKTDSIKIPNADDDITQFCMDFAQRYGYKFEWEATYDRMCLVNDAVYIARYRNEDGSLGDWTATGAQFAHPYIFKTLFTHEDIDFKDLCEIKQVQNSSMYLDMNENLEEGEHDYHFIGRVGSFVPIKPGKGGGLLVRTKDKEKYDAVNGTKGYRWLESDMVAGTPKEKDIDMSYYEALADEAKSDISKYGDFEWFVSDDLEPFPMNPPE